MPSPLVRTKLYVPPVRRGLVPRPRLADRLGGDAQPRLTLISAPAGFGKTTLLAALGRTPRRRRSPGRLGVAGGERAAARRRSGPTSSPPCDRGARASAPARSPLLQSGQPADRDRPRHAAQRARARCRTSSTWSSTTTTSPTGPAIADDVAFLLEHLPAAGAPGDQHPRRPRPAAGPAAGPRRAGRGPRGRPAVHRSTRSRRTSTTSIGLDLDAADVAALEGRTEGWIAALQLAALSLQGRDDAAGFIAGFAGDDRYVVDYLVEEVLGRQPDDVRDFLLDTSILDRLTGPLCDAVTGGDRRQGRCSSRWSARTCSSSRSTTAASWYRYHHLFADVLRAHLLERAARATSPACTGAPPTWYDAAGEPVAAVRHALAAGDVERGGRPRRARDPGLLRERQEAIDPPLGRRHPGRRRAATARCSRSGFIGGLMSSGDFDGVERPARRRRAAAGRPARRTLVVVDEAELRPAARRRSRCTAPRWRSSRGDPAGTVAHADRGDRPRRRRRRPHASRPRRPCRGLASWAQRRPRGGAPRATRAAVAGSSAPGTSPTCSAARSRWPTSASPRAGSATPAHLRGRARARRRARGRRDRCAARPTCTSG